MRGFRSCCLSRGWFSFLRWHFVWKNSYEGFSVHNSISATKRTTVDILQFFRKQFLWVYIVLSARVALRNSEVQASPVAALI